MHGTNDKQEHEKIRERSMRGRKARLESGKIHNAGVSLYGYRINREEGKREIYEPEAEVVRMIFDLCANEGMGCHAISRHLMKLDIPSPSVGRRKLRNSSKMVWQKSAVYRILHNEAYIGKTVQWKMTTSGSKTHTARPRPESDHVKLPEGTTPALVSKDLFDRAQKVLAANVGRFTRNNDTATVMLRGVVYCGVCNRTMTPKFDRGVLKFQCATRNDPSEPTCANARLFGEPIDQFVWEWVSIVLKYPSNITRAIRKLQQDDSDSRTYERDLKFARQSLSETNQSIANLIDRIATYADDDPEIEAVFKEKLKTLKEQKKGFSEMIAELERLVAKNQKRVADLTNIRRLAISERERIDSYSIDEKIALIRKLGLKVYAHGWNDEESTSRVQQTFYRIDFPVQVKAEYSIDDISDVDAGLPADVQDYINNRADSMPETLHSESEITAWLENLEISDNSNVAVCNGDTMIISFSRKIAA